MNKEEIKDWRYCYDCGCELFGTPPDEDMNGITVSVGDCSRCGKKNVTLIPVVDFTGKGN